VRFFRNLALLVYFLDLPIPIYWFILHPFTNFWRRNIRAAFWFAGLTSWIIAAIFVIAIRDRLLAETNSSFAIVLFACALIAADFILLFYSGKNLGGRTLVGHSELSGKNELKTLGLYKYIRHPRYTGMIAAMIGASILAHTNFAWIVFAIWFACVMFSIYLEEREMRRRFGKAYEEYARATPRFLPWF
jgi:protein-S-isoprenylcysteine O-methyltransferase Ste14